MDYTFKVCICGEGGIGKTALINRYLTGFFNPAYKMTVGVEFHTKKLAVKGKNVILQIWDFAGEKQFRFLLPSYVRGSAGGIFMYDITRESSFNALTEWVDIFKKGFKEKVLKVPLLLVGSKSDLEQDRKVSSEKAIEFVKKFNFLNYIECSSKNGENVEKVFEIIGRAMIK